MAKPFSFHSPQAQSRPRSNSPSPSSAILALLATISASENAAHALPLRYSNTPPDFLCPSLSSSRSQSASSSQPRRLKRDLRRPFVPAKYVQGDDGRWRKSDTWSLYGSSSCQGAQCLPKDTSLPVVDDQVQPTQTTTINFQPSADTSMGADFPPGWTSKTKDDGPLDAIILTLSLLLAVIICIFMVGCISWRKKQRAHAREHQDLEQKQRSRSYDPDSDDEDNHDIKRIRSQQRMWSKATARWRANVRLSARRRRVQRSLAIRESISSTAATSMASLHTVSSSTSLPRSRRNLSTFNHPPPVLPSPSRPHSALLDGHPSRPTSPLSSAPPVSLPVSPAPLLAPSPTSSSSQPQQPPAYPTSQRPDGQFLDSSDPSGSQPPVINPAAMSTATPPAADEDHPLYAPSADAAHVATDDKILLSRMAALASSPPPEWTSDSQAQDPGTSSGTVYPSVPALLDEFEETELTPSILGLSGPGPDGRLSLAIQPPAPSYSHDPSSSPFPLPPSKSPLAVPLFYHYPSSFEEDVINTEPPTGPSAPPFEMAPSVPSAPPLDMDESPNVVDVIAFPSAPPLPEDDQMAEHPFAVPSGPIAASTSPSTADAGRQRLDGSGCTNMAPTISPPPEPSSPPPSHAQTPPPLVERNPPDYLP